MLDNFLGATGIFEWTAISQKDVLWKAKLAPVATRGREREIHQKRNPTDDRRDPNESRLDNFDIVSDLSMELS